MELRNLTFRVFIYDDFLTPFIKHRPVTEGHPLINGQVFENHAVFACTYLAVSKSESGSLGSRPVQLGEGPYSTA